MKVDRNRFLMLTTALAAATAVGAMVTGCTVTSTDKGTPPITDCKNASCDAGNDAYVSEAGDGGDASACLTDDGVAPTCEGLDVSCQAACAGYLANYKKGVARDITACLLKLPTCEGASTEIASCVQGALGRACDDPSTTSFCTPFVMSCGGDGGDGGPQSLDLGECKDVATGLNSAGRAAFTSCVTEGTAGYCIASPTSCIDAIE